MADLRTCGHRANKNRIYVYTQSDDPTCLRYPVSDLSPLVQAAVERCPSDRPDLLRRLLGLLLAVTGYRGGAAVSDPSDCARRCGRLLAAAALPEEPGAAAADLAACLLSAENARLPATDAVKLLHQVGREL